MKLISIDSERGDIHPKKLELIRLERRGKFGIYLSFRSLSSSQFLSILTLYRYDTLADLSIELDTVASFSDIPPTYAVRLYDLKNDIETVLSVALSTLVKKVLMERDPDTGEVEIAVTLPQKKILGARVPFKTLSGFLTKSKTANIDKAIK